MQTVSDAVKTLLSNYAKITLTSYLDGEKLDAGIGTFKYEASCGTDQEFSFGNACASMVDFVLAASLPDMKDHAVAITWAVDATEYPLFFGQVEKATVSGGRTTIKAWDAMYYGGSRVFAPTAEMLCDINAAVAFSLVAADIGVDADTDALALLSDITITGGFADLPEESTNSAAAGHIAGLVGGNAWINRSGRLAICRPTEVDFESEPYTGGAGAENNDYYVTGVTMQREIISASTNDDGTTSENAETVEFFAGDGTLMVSNPLADQAAAERAFEALAYFTVRPGNYSFPGGVELEPGDIVRIHSMDGTYSVMATVIQMSFDGGVKTAISSGGHAESGGAAGQINQALKTLYADLARVKTLIAENASIVSAKITNLTVDDLRAGRIRSTDFAVTTVEMIYPSTNLYPSDTAYPSNGEEITRGIEIDFAAGVIRGVFFNTAVDALKTQIADMESQQSAMLERIAKIENSLVYPKCVTSTSSEEGNL